MDEQEMRKLRSGVAGMQYRMGVQNTALGGEGWGVKGQGIVDT